MLQDSPDLVTFQSVTVGAEWETKLLLLSRSFNSLDFVGVHIRSFIPVFFCMKSTLLAGSVLYLYCQSAYDFAVMCFYWPSAMKLV